MLKVFCIDDIGLVRLDPLTTHWAIPGLCWIPRDSMRSAEVPMPSMKVLSSEALLICGNTLVMVHIERW